MKSVKSNSTFSAALEWNDKIMETHVGTKPACLKWLEDRRNKRGVKFIFKETKITYLEF